MGLTVQTDCVWLISFYMILEVWKKFLPHLCSEFSFSQFCFGDKRTLDLSWTYSVDTNSEECCTLKISIFSMMQLFHKFRRARTDFKRYTM